MAGHNHFASCSCGWCSGGGGNGGRTEHDLSSYISDPSPSATPRTDEARTYKTQCKWCGADVYYHTNGYGDSVLFDSLGCPWQVHGCWVKNRGGEGVHLFDINFEKSKCLVLSGAIRLFQSKGKIPTEIGIALELGVSIEVLRANYRNHYAVVSGSDNRIVIRRGF
jgi:hypothetical protein